MSRTPNELTPAMRQYLEAKSQVPDALMLFRMGDFYELFFEDAVEASQLLDIALTSRDKNSENPVPMCGVPHHALNTYVPRLLQAGKKVAICEQMEDPSQAQGIVRREIVRVLSPGVILDLETLDATTPNFLAALFPGPGGLGFAYLDASTGTFRATFAKDAGQLSIELARIEPRELVFPSAAQGVAQKLRSLLPASFIHPADDALFGKTASLAETLADAQSVPPETLSAAAGLANYLQNMARNATYPLDPLILYQIQDSMVLDETAVNDLELFRTLSRREKRGSLLWVLDKTQTAMGARLLRQWITYPLLQLEAIEARLDAVDELVKSSINRQALLLALKGLHDAERLLTRAVAGQATPRELLMLARSAVASTALAPLLAPLGASLLNQLAAQLSQVPDCVNEAASFLADPPPMYLGEGKTFKHGYHPELDELYRLEQGSEEWLLAYETEERTKTGIPSLKVRYNRVFGYYIELTKANLHLAPDNYIRKQTLVNAERFFTQELKEYEERALHAQERIAALEAQLFRDLMARIAASREQLQRSFHAVAGLDVLVALSEVAHVNRYARPVVTHEDAITIQDGRHPVVELSLERGRFVPNDVQLDAEERQIMMITGPNMAGKSTIMRQVALTVILAQMGSFVPARSARIGVVDRIFTRVGATDSLSQGLSTFMVEMKEASEILKHASRRSLVILDEVGRGTSTYDGLSIAWAIAEYLHDFLRCRTLFATHYHELTQMCQYKKRVVNCCVAVKEFNEDILFLHKLIEGAASRSYGVQVARLAGVPLPVIERAKEILLSLEEGGGDILVARPRPVKRRRSLDGPGLFEWREGRLGGVQEASNAADGRGAAVTQRLLGVALDLLTPIEALNLVYALRKELESDQGGGTTC